MDAEQIVRITPEVIRSLIQKSPAPTIAKQGPGRREQERWPFAGTVELWLPDTAYGEKHILATLHNISAGGLAVRSRLPIQTDTRVDLALHQPDLSCYGQAIVRHCTSAPSGYLIGVEFLFSDGSESDES